MRNVIQTDQPYQHNKIFCIGLSRTGTTSLCKALSMLGFNTLHFSLELFVHPEIISEELKFTPALELRHYWNWWRRKELNAINRRFNPDTFFNYDAYGDLPIPLYFKELDKKFPGSKFIYTHRDEESWLKSMHWLYNDGAVHWKHGFLVDEIKFKTYHTITYHEKKLLHSYRKHHQAVTAYFRSRPQDLLVMDISAGNATFDLLCEFLHVENPQQPFPKNHISHEVTMNQRLRYYLGRKLPFYNLVGNRLYSSK